MKRLLVAIAVALFASAAFAQFADRDVLVTPDGAVYSVEVQSPSSSAAIAATTALTLSIQHGSDTQHMYVPESLSAGFHFGGALAYDVTSKTLFVIWTHMPNAMSSELLLASYRDGKWQSAISIDDHPYHLHTNLRLGITRHVSQLQSDGTYADAPALLLHALWWDDSGSGEEARYALMPIENGAVSQSAIEIHSLEEFVAGGNDEPVNSVDKNFNAEILRHPAIVSSPMQSSVDVVFGDTKKNSIHIVTLHPTAESRIHIPVGIGGGNGNNGGGNKRAFIVAPESFSADWKGTVNVIAHGDRLVFANADQDKTLNYITYSDGTWSDVKSIALSNKLTVETALSAVDKMVSSQ